MRTREYMIRSLQAHDLEINNIREGYVDYESMSYDRLTELFEVDCLDENGNELYVEHPYTIK